MSIEAVDGCLLGRMKAITEALETHELLVSHPNLIRQAVRILCGSELEPDLLDFFTTVTHRFMGVGRFCLIHNHIVDDLILKQRWDELIDHVMKGREVCVEIYDPKAMSIKESTELKQRLSLEFQAVSTAISNYGSDNHDSRILPVKDCEDDTSLAGVCYTKICVASGHMSTPMDVTREKRILERRQGEITPMLYCYDLLDLLHDVAIGPGLNRYSGRQFDSSLVEELKTRYDKEIKMMQRYDRWLTTYEAPEDQ